MKFHVLIISIAKKTTRKSTFGIELEKSCRVQWRNGQEKFIRFMIESKSMAENVHENFIFKFSIQCCCWVVECTQLKPLASPTVRTPQEWWTAQSKRDQNDIKLTFFYFTRIDLKCFFFSLQFWLHDPFIKSL